MDLIAWTIAVLTFYVTKKTLFRFRNLEAEWRPTQLELSFKHGSLSRNCFPWKCLWSWNYLMSHLNFKLGFYGIVPSQMIQIQQHLMMVLMRFSRGCNFVSSLFLAKEKSTLKSLISYWRLNSIIFCVKSQRVWLFMLTLTLILSKESSSNKQ